MVKKLVIVLGLVSRNNGNCIRCGLVYACK